MKTNEIRQGNHMEEDDDDSHLEIEKLLQTLTLRLLKCELEDFELVCTSLQFDKSATVFWSHLPFMAIWNNFMSMSNNFAFSVILFEVSLLSGFHCILN